jgi:hypothetical protein
MRVKLEFRQPDQAPVVEILANTAQAAVHDKVLKYLSQYRLPCLGANGDGGPVIATQEFHFDPLGDADGKPLRLVGIASDPARACLVMPKWGPEAPKFVGSGIAKVLIEASFTGDGASAPEVKILHSDNRKAERSVLENLAEYRMPCRKTGDKPFTFRQNFTYAVGEAQAAKFTEPLMALPRFLGSVRGIKQQSAYFDFSTMGCPFRVQWELRRPVQDNDARTEGAPNPNRAEFLAWLQGLELDLSAKQTRALLGESVLLDIPCGVLDLRPSEAPTSKAEPS